MGDEERRYRTTLDHLLQGFQIIGHDWRYIYLNPAAAAHGRRTPAELEGKKMWEAYPGIEQTPLFEVLARCMSERTPAALENIFSFADGVTRWFELRIEPVPEGLCVHSVDIDERKRAEAAMLQLQHELEQRVAQRTRELELANKELAAFSYSVSHDLRAPLRSIDGFALALTEDCATLDAESRGHLDRIRAAAQRMGLLIDDMLQLSRISRSPLRHVPVSLSQLAERVLEELRGREPGRPVQTRIEPDLWVEGDPGLLRIALENLLSNAWKFSARVPLPQIELGREQTDNGTVFFVRDNGAGFDPALAGKLFQPFQRLHYESDFSGTGIGLATVQRVLARHGGQVWAEGRVGEGAKLSFTLPGAGDR